MTYENALVLGTSRRPSAVVMVVILLIAGVTAFWPSELALLRNWADIADYKQGYFIVAVTAVWIFQLRHRINATRARRALWILPLLVAAMLLWLVAYRGNSELLQQLVIPVILLLAVWSAAGAEMARLVAAPLALLYFAIPVWENFVPLLQSIATAVAEQVLAIMGVPTVVSGNNVTIPAGTFSIVEGCSGKRYLLIALTFAMLAGMLQQLRTKWLLILLAVAGGLALITNWIRIVTIIYAGHLTDMQHYLITVDHGVFGWVLFVPLLAVVLLLARRFGRMEHAVIEYFVPHGSAHLDDGKAVWVPVIALFALPLAATLIRYPAQNLNSTLGELPPAAIGWQGPTLSVTEWRPQFEAATAHRQAAYMTADGVVEVYLNLYPQQEPGRELIFYSNSIMPKGWAVLSRLPAPENSSAPLLVRSEVRDNLGRRWVVAHVYSVGGSLASGSVETQLVYGLRSILRPVRSGVVALAARCDDDCAGAAGLIDRLWQVAGVNLISLVNGYPHD